MINTKPCFIESITSPVRRVKGRVELYQGSTLLNIFNATDKLKSFTLDRTTDESKFFGYGLCQKLTVKLRDEKRDIHAEKDMILEADFGTDCDYVYTNPAFYIKDISRNETNNELTLTAYDALYNATSYTLQDLELDDIGYTIRGLITACAATLNLHWTSINVDDECLDTLYPFGANFGGDETIRIVLDAIAEATQSIYYIDHTWTLVFKRLDIHGEPVAIIDKSQYFNLDNKDAYTITALCHTTELGDDVIAGSAEKGQIHYIRDNPLWNTRNDIGELVTKALAAVNGLTITQFNCSWRGNYLIEIGDKIGFITKDDETIVTYLLNDSITYDGALSETSMWNYTSSNNETAANPATLTDSFKKTSARVDKVNQEIELIVSNVDNHTDKLSQLTVDVDGISAEVSRVERVANENFDSVNGDIVTLTSKVEAAMTAEDVTIAIKKEIDNGVTKVETTTGFKFDEVGLTVSKSGSEMTTTITEDGMRVYRDGNEVLIADNKGVKAENLHATTYLIIGLNSRFEDYESSRTGCFWIGG